VLVTAARYRAKQAGLPFDLDQFADQLQARIDAGRCEISGLPFRLDGGRTWDSPSLDRIIPELGYTITNVRVVLFALNVMMNTWGEEPVLKVADGIKELRASAQEHPLAKWEARLKERLSKVGSTEFPLTWSQSVTPSGRPISRLAPSMRRTSDSGSIGSQWATPQARDHFPAHTPEYIAAKKAEGHGMANLNDQVSAWATPKASDGEGGRTTKTEGGGNAHLPIQARESASWATPRVTANGGRGFGTRERMARARLEDQACGTPSGATQNCASAPTAKRGALAPEFVFWLMGFPAEWVSCALAAMQSFRKSRPKSSAR